MDTAVINQKTPYLIHVNAGEKYYWCSCGRSGNQAVCDGSHKGTEFLPIEYEADESKRVFFCGCKHNQQGVVCDGSHTTL